MVSASFERARGFIALVGGAGYAGLFAIWGWVSPHLDRWQVLLIAALLGLSLLEFIVWQLYGRFVIARQQIDFFYLVSAKDADFDAEFASRRAELFRIECDGFGNPRSYALPSPVSSAVSCSCRPALSTWFARPERGPP